MFGIVSGYSSATKILGIGALEKDDLIKEAKQDLYEKHLHNKNVKLTNFSVDIKNSYFLFLYAHTLVTVSADLYNCSSELSNNELKKSFKVKGIAIGDTVKLFYQDFLYTALVRGHGKKACIIAFTSVNFLENKKVKYEKIYAIEPNRVNKEIYGFDIGDSAYVKIKYGDTILIKQCEIKGINSNNFLFQYKSEKGTLSTKEAMRSVVFATKPEETN
jgi:hypothetical protein